MSNYARIFTITITIVSVVSFRLPTHATEFFVDNFDDGDHQDQMPVRWSRGAAPGGNRVVEAGRLLHEPDVTNMSTYVAECFGEDECFFEDVSLRTSFQVVGFPTYVTLFARSWSSPDGTLYGGTDASGNALLAMSIGASTTFLSRTPTNIDVSEGEISMRFDVDGDAMALWIWPTGEDQPDAPNATATIPESYPRDDGGVGFFYNPGGSSAVSFDYFAAVPVNHEDIVGDFNFDGRLGIEDLDALAAQIRLGFDSALFDVTSDGLVDQLDRESWVREIKRTWIGDANLDREFNSTDLVEIFQAGEFEDQVANNSSWSTGDWNGDQEFDSGDLVFAFQDGGFEQGLRKVVQAVPEPNTACLLLLGSVSLVLRKRGGP